MEKIKLYNEQGKVENPEIAHEMANTEDPYHKKRLGIFPPSKDKLSEGEARAEQVGQRMVDIENWPAEEEERTKAVAEYIKQNKKIIAPAEKLPDNLKRMAGDFMIYGDTILFFDKNGNACECPSLLKSAPVHIHKIFNELQLRKLGFHDIEEISAWEDKFNEIQKIAKEYEEETMKKEREEKAKNFEF